MDKKDENSRDYASAITQIIDDRASSVEDLDTWPESWAAIGRACIEAIDQGKDTGAAIEKTIESLNGDSAAIRRELYAAANSRFKGTQEDIGDTRPGEIPELPDFAGLPEDLGRDASPWLDLYIGFSRRWSPRSFDGFHEACALWLLSTIAARRVVVTCGKQEFTNLSLMLCGRTTMHAKSSATDIAMDVLHTCGLEYLLAPDEATPQSFVRFLTGADLPTNFDALDEERRTSAQLRLGFAGQKGWFAEEFGSWLASMMRTDGHMADFRGLLRRFDDCPPEYSRSTIARQTERIQRPYLSLIGNLTPADLRPLAKKGSLLWGDGFLARFAFITPLDGEILTGRFPRDRRVIPAEISQPLVEWHHRLGLPQVTIQSSPDGTPSAIVIPPKPSEAIISDEVWNAFYSYNEALLLIAEQSDLTDLDGNYGRLHIKALRIAALLASLENCRQIEMRHWARAQEITERWRIYTHRLYKQVTQAQGSAQPNIEDKILSILARWQGKGPYVEGMTANEISRFIEGVDRATIKSHAERLVEAGDLKKHIPQGTRADRYYVPTAEKP